MTDVPRISAREARARMLSSTPPLLVLAYDDEAKFKLMGLEGAISLPQLRARKAVPRHQEIIFYCG